jgi:hypothetical protein
VEQQNSIGAQPRPPGWMAAVFVAVGLCIIAMALGVIRVDPHALKAPRWVLACAGGLFALCGLLIPAQRVPGSLYARLLVASFFSMFAAVFGWVGFGPGPRTFSSTTMLFGVATRAASGATSGRVVFGAVAVGVGVAAAAAWWGLGRAMVNTLRRT